MTVEILEIVRNSGFNNTTHVTFTRDGKVYEFLAGRHTGINQIKRLAETLKLVADADDCL